VRHGGHLLHGRHHQLRLLAHGTLLVHQLAQESALLFRQRHAHPLLLLRHGAHSLFLHR
jgi:hypothetical protein